MLIHLSGFNCREITNISKEFTGKMQMVGEGYYLDDGKVNCKKTNLVEEGDTIRSEGINYEVGPSHFLRQIRD